MTGMTPPTEPQQSTTLRSLALMYVAVEVRIGAGGGGETVLVEITGSTEHARQGP